MGQRTQGSLTLSSNGGLQYLQGRRRLPAFLIPTSLAQIHVAEALIWARVAEDEALFPNSTSKGRVEFPCQERQAEKTTGYHSSPMPYLEAGHHFERDGLLSLPLALEQWHRGFASVESGYKTESFKASPKCTGFIWNIAWGNSSLRVLLKTMVMVVMGP